MAIQATPWRSVDRPVPNPSHGFSCPDRLPWDVPAMISRGLSGVPGYKKPSSSNKTYRRQNNRRYLTPGIGFDDSPHANDIAGYMTADAMADND
jgi:hypothetical protein